MREEASEDIASGLWHAEDRFPERPALLHGRRSTSFEELASQTRRLIGPLLEAGAGPGRPVALYLENSLAFVAAHYALASIGAVIVPLNPQFRGRTLGEALELSQAVCIVARSELLPFLQSLPSRPTALRSGVVIDGGETPERPLELSLLAEDLADPVSGSRCSLADSPERERPDSRDPNAPAVLFMSSGTTGQPKGILVTGRQLLLGADAWTRRWKFGHHTVSLMVAPFFHVVYNPLVLGAHRCGGAAVVVASLNARGATREAQASRANAIMGTPFFFMQLLNDKVSLARDLSAIDTVIFGAAPMPPPVIGRLRGQFPRAALYNCYGLTEACSAVSCLGPEHVQSHPASVGRAHPGVELSIRGEDLLELPAGEIGEVWCRGPNVIDRYHRSPEATAARTHEGWLRTGDMGYLDDGSFLYLVGRTDDMINIAGDKMYPSEIEDVLHLHPDVLDAAVTIAPDPQKGDCVKAFVVAREARALDTRELRRFCLRHLPPTFVPRVFEPVAELPRNPSGKVLRRLLLAEPRGPATP